MVIFLFNFNIEIVSLHFQETLTLCFQPNHILKRTAHQKIYSLITDHMCPTLLAINGSRGFK